MADFRDTRDERRAALRVALGDILLVEDEPDLQWRLARTLTVHGARVVGTSSAQAALAAIERWPADLVLLDEQLAGMGLDLVRRIRARHPAISVALMSDAPSPELRRAARAAGAVDTLSRPVRLEAIAGLLARSKRLDPANASQAELSAAAE